MNNKGSTGFSWMYGLIMLFGLGLLYIVFNYVFEGQLVPVMTQITNSTITDPVQRQIILDGYSKYLAYFHLLPFILFIIVIIYMVVSAIRKEGESGEM